MKNFRKEKKNLFVKKIKELYDSQSCYPPIKEIMFVCCDVTHKKYKKYEQNIMELRDYLYDIASEMKLSLSECPYMASCIIIGCITITIYTLIILK